MVRPVREPIPMRLSLVLLTFVALAHAQTTGGSTSGRGQLICFAHNSTADVTPKPPEIQVVCGIVNRHLYSMSLDMLMFGNRHPTQVGLSNSTGGLITSMETTVPHDHDPSTTTAEVYLNGTSKDGDCVQHTGVTR